MKLKFQVVLIQESLLFSKSIILVISDHCFSYQSKNMCPSSASHSHFSFFQYLPLLLTFAYLLVHGLFWVGVIDMWLICFLVSGIELESWVVKWLLQSWVSRNVVYIYLVNSHMSGLLKKGGDCFRLCNVCWEQGVVPRGWQEACVVLLYKGNNRNCTNYIIEA